MYPSITGIAPAAARKGAGGEEGEGDARARVKFQTVGAKARSRALPRASAGAPNFRRRIALL